jgi:hypothetical protein
MDQTHVMPGRNRLSIDKAIAIGFVTLGNTAVTYAQTVAEQYALGESARSRFRRVRAEDLTESKAPYSF